MNRLIQEVATTTSLELKTLGIRIMRKLMAETASQFAPEFFNDLVMGMLHDILFDCDDQYILYETLWLLTNLFAVNMRKEYEKLLIKHSIIEGLSRFIDLHNYTQSLPIDEAHIEYKLLEQTLWCLNNIFEDASEEVKTQLCSSSKLLYILTEIFDKFKASDSIFSISTWCSSSVIRMMPQDTEDADSFS